MRRRSSLSVQAQIEAQIRYALATGELKPGDPLPSINELSQHLSVNRNTIQQVYQRLSGIGLIESAHGRGVFVSGTPGAVADVPALAELIERSLHEALTLGVSPRAFSHFLQSEAHGFEMRFPLVAFVECNPYQVNEFAEQIAERWQMRVKPVLLSTLHQPGALPATCKVVLTTYIHYPEVTQSAQTHDRFVRPVVLDIVSGLREALHDVPPDVRAGVISRFEGVPEVENVILTEARTRGLNVSVFPYRAGDNRALTRFLAGLDVLICPDATREAVLRVGERKLPSRILSWKAKLDVAQLDSLQQTLSIVRAW